MSKQKIAFTLPADLEFSSLVRRISEEIFNHAGFTKEWISRLKLVVDELFMNANLYGSKADVGKIYLSYVFDENEAHVRIEDEGSEEKKMNAKQLNELIEKNSVEKGDITKTSGRGLALISSLWTDDMNVEDSLHGGIAISFTKKIGSGTPPTPSSVLRLPKESAKHTVKHKTVSLVAPKGFSEVIKISGEMDGFNFAEKVKPIADKVKTLSEGSILALDCEELTYINSTFIGHLAAWLNEMQSKNGQLVLKNVNEQIREVIELVGLSRVIYLES